MKFTIRTTLLTATFLGTAFAVVLRTLRKRHTSAFSFIPIRTRFIPPVTVRHSLYLPRDHPPASCLRSTLIRSYCPARLLIPSLVRVSRW